MCNSAHPPSIVAKLGAVGAQAVLLAKCLDARLVVRLHHVGMAVLAAMLACRRACPLGHQRFVVVGVVHSREGATQRLH